ncbi:MAG: polysaccharide pyruvyl transferase family protein, partial [Acidimicrobiales bacterium]
MPSVVTLGAAYSANKGAASMVQALVDALPTRVTGVRFVAVSTHAGGDRPTLRRAGSPVTVVSQRPVELLVLHVPLALLAGLLRFAHLPWRWVCRPAALRAVAGADVVADISGISFVDGRRRAVVIYNALLVAVPLLLGRPVVKCAQAMGPLRSPLNRALARLVLPRLLTICPRGASTEAHLRAFGLTNLVPANDLAFAMEVPVDVRTRMKRDVADRAGPGPYLVVSPSQVVDSSCRDRGIDYRGIMAAFIDAAVEGTDLTVVIVAHSAQLDAGVNHMNDLPLCRAIHAALDHRDQAVLFDDDLLPTELRAVIGLADVLVTSRFHAMISAL